MAEGSYRRKTGRYWMEVHENALEELAELRAERDIKESELEMLNQEILRLEQAAAGLNLLASDGEEVIRVGIRVEGIAEMGLADACREILKQSPTYRTARGIRDSLRASGYNLDQHTNHLASIHGVLKRMKDSGEIEELESEGKTRYRSKGATVIGPPRRTLPNEGVTVTEPPLPPPTRRKNSFQELAAETFKRENKD